MRRKAGIAATLAAVAGLLAAGCGLFETRDPEQPSTKADCGLPLTSGATATVFNLQQFFGRSGYETCYDNLIDSSFAFHPDLQDSSLFLPEAPFVDWNREVEINVNGKIATTADFILVQFLGKYADTIISPDQATEQRFLNYQVKIRDDSLLVANDTLRFTGKADLTLHRGSNGEWKVTSWLDHRGGATPDSTWGRLRGIYRTTGGT